MKKFNNEMFTVNSLNKNITVGQFKTITILFHSQEWNPNTVIADPFWDEELWNETKQQNGAVNFKDGEQFLLGNILETEKVIKNGKEMNMFVNLPNLNVVQAAVLLDYLTKAPKKNSNNGPVEVKQGTPPRSNGFGGAKK